MVYRFIHFQFFDCLPHDFRNIGKWNCLHESIVEPSGSNLTLKTLKSLEERPCSVQSLLTRGVPRRKWETKGTGEVGMSRSMGGEVLA